ncbi:unnamed protein product [Cladocopium goreaui]|uniref:Uncharacterized protein n=1 Tax=Cladocopium goreaui TaxID=2562237 RepID=A0A9P1G855_9DINO|nr:unnamed protein product [Cladocopium goreaui]
MARVSPVRRREPTFNLYITSMHLTGESSELFSSPSSMLMLLVLQLAASTRLCRREMLHARGTRNHLPTTAKNGEKAHITCLSPPKIDEIEKMYANHLWPKAHCVET